MKKTGKAISVILPISLMLSSTPNPSALAETTLPTSSESYSFDTFSAVYNTATHILFINGTGELGADSFPTPLPWEEYKDEIRALILSDGVTSITTSIFSDLPGLTNVSLPASIDHIEKDAFLGCPGIQFLAFPGDYNELSKIITENGVTELLAPVAAALEAQLAESSTPAPLPSVTPATTKLVPSDERRISSYHDDDDSSDGSDGNRENEPEEPSDSEIPSDPEKTPAPSETTAPPKAPTPTPEVDYTKTDDQGRVTEGRETAEDGSVDKYTVFYDDEDETQTKTGTIKNTDGSVVKYTLYSRADGTPISRSDIVTYPDGGIDSFTTDYNEAGIKSGLSGTYKKTGTTDKYNANFTNDGFLSERKGTLTNDEGSDEYTLTYDEDESPVTREGTLTRPDNSVDKYEVTYKENNTSERTGKIYNGEALIDDYTNTYNGSIISSSSGTRTENGITDEYHIQYDANGNATSKEGTETRVSTNTIDNYEITYSGSTSTRTGSITENGSLDHYYEIVKDGDTTVSEDNYHKDNNGRRIDGTKTNSGVIDNYTYSYPVNSASADNYTLSGTKIEDGKENTHYTINVENGLTVSNKEYHLDSQNRETWAKIITANGTDEYTFDVEKNIKEGTFTSADGVVETYTIETKDDTITESRFNTSTNKGTITVTENGKTIKTDTYTKSTEDGLTVYTGSITENNATTYYIKKIDSNNTIVSNEEYHKNGDQITDGWIEKDGIRDDYTYEYSEDGTVKRTGKQKLTSGQDERYSIITKNGIVTEEHHYQTTTDNSIVTTEGWIIKTTDGKTTREEYTETNNGSTTTRVATQYSGSIKDESKITLTYTETTKANSDGTITITNDATDPNTNYQTITIKKQDIAGNYLSGSERWNKTPNDTDNYHIYNYGEKRAFLSGEEHWKEDDDNYGNKQFGEDKLETAGYNHTKTGDIVSEESYTITYKDGIMTKKSTITSTGTDSSSTIEFYDEITYPDEKVVKSGHVVDSSSYNETSKEYGRWYSTYTETTEKLDNNGEKTTTIFTDHTTDTHTERVVEKDANDSITSDTTSWYKTVNGVQTDNGHYVKDENDRITSGYQEIYTEGKVDIETFQIEYNLDGSSTRTADVTRTINNEDGTKTTQKEHYTETTNISDNATTITKHSDVWEINGETQTSLGSYILIDTRTSDGYHTVDRTDINGSQYTREAITTQNDTFVSASRSYTAADGYVVNTEYDSHWTETEREWTEDIPEGKRTESYDLIKNDNDEVTGRKGTVTITYEDGHTSIEEYTITLKGDSGQTRSGTITTTTNGVTTTDEYDSTTNSDGSETSRTGKIKDSSGKIISDYEDKYTKIDENSYYTSHSSKEANGVVFYTNITRNVATGDSQSVISWLQTVNGKESGFISYEIGTGTGDNATCTKTVVTAVGDGTYYRETDGDEKTRETCERDWKPTGWTDPSPNTDNTPSSNTVSPLSLTSPLNTLNPLSLEDSKLLAFDPLIALDGLELEEGESEEELTGEELEDDLDEDGNPRYISSDEALPAGEDEEETEDSLNGEDENGENIEGNEDELSSTFFFKNAQISTKDQGFIKITKVGDNDVGDELQIVGFTIIPKESDDIKTEDEDAENSTEPSDETFVSDERTIGDNGENNVTEESTTSSDTSTASPTYTPDTTDSSSTTQHSGSVGTSDYSDSYDGDYSDSGDDTYSNPSETTSGTDSDNTDTENVQQPTEPSANEPSAHEKPAEDPQDSEISSETENPPEDQSTPYESPLKDAFVELEPEPVIPPEDEKPDEGDQTEETQTGETEIETGANTETQEIPQKNTGNTETGETSSQNTSNSHGYNRGDDDYEYSDGGSGNTSNTNDSPQETPGIETIPDNVVSADTTTGDTPDVTIPEIVEPSGDESTANDSETKQDESAPVAGDDENTDVDSSNTDGTTDPNASGESETDAKSADSSESAENGDSGSGDSVSGTDSTSDNTADGDNSSSGSTDGSSGYSEPSSGNSESSSDGSSGGSDSSSGSSGGSDSSSGSSGGSDSSSGSSGGSDSSSGSSGGSDSSSSSSGGSGGSSNESPSAPSAPSEPAQSESAQPEPAQSEPAQSEPVQSEPAQSSEPDSSVSDDGRIVIVPSTFDDNTDFGVENVVKVKNAGNFASLLKNVRKAAARFFGRG